MERIDDMRDNRISKTISTNKACLDENVTCSIFLLFIFYGKYVNYTVSCFHYKYTHMQKHIVYTMIGPLSGGVGSFADSETLFYRKNVRKLVKMGT